MAAILFKWFLVASVGILSPSVHLHPLYISVVEIEHNEKEKTLELSCKIFTDDFEKALRNTTTSKVDLLNPKMKDAMNKLVNEYVQKHLLIFLEGKKTSMRFIGYEEIEEGIYCYYQIDNVSKVKNIAVVNNVLYEYKSTQMGYIHVTVNGNRKSSKLNNPEEKVFFSF